MSDEKKDRKTQEDINTIKDGETLEDQNAEEFGEPVKE